MAKRQISTLMLLAACAIPAALQAQPLARPGVVVEELEKGSFLVEAGVQPGDILHAWEPHAPASPPGPGKSQINSYLDWLWLDDEWAQRSPVNVTAERRGMPESFTFPLKPWRVRVAPRLPTAVQAAYEEGKGLVKSGAIQAGISRWREVSETAIRENDQPVLCWIQQRISEVLSTDKAWDAAAAALVVVSTDSYHPLCRAAALEGLGNIYQRSNNLVKANEAYSQALGIREAAFGKSLGLADSHLLLAKNAWLRGQLDAAASHGEEALKIAKVLAPAHPAMVAALNSLGSVAALKGDLATAESHIQQALAIQRNLEPESRFTTAMLLNLGNVLRSRGELRQAELYYQQSLDMKRRLDPVDPDIAQNLNNLGATAAARGDVDEAVRFYKEAVALSTASSPSTLLAAMFRTNLGNIYLARGDSELTERYYQEALTIGRKVAPNSLEVAASLNNLGVASLSRGDLSAAESYYKQALDIERKIAPRSLNVSHSLANLGIVAWKRRDLELAVKYQEEALAIQENVASLSLDIAHSHQQFGILFAEARNLPEAFEHEKKALAIFEQLAPESEDAANALYQLGVLNQMEGKKENAVAFFGRAIEASEWLAQRLGRSQEARAGFRAQHRDVYRNSIQLLLELGRVDEAFRALERSRAQGFLELLAERDLVFPDVPIELASNRSRLAAEYDRTQQKIFDRSSKSQELAPHELARLRKIHDELDEADEAIRRSSPRLATLQSAQLLNSLEAAKILDPGTALLSFCVGAKKSWVFILTRGAGVRVQELPVGEAELREAVAELRSLIHEARAGSFGSSRREILAALTARLYSWLIAPVVSSIEDSSRLVIIPDGPLHLLPWAALTRSSTEAADAHGHYLAERKPLHLALSATLYAQLQRLRSMKREARGEFAAFGDPIYNNGGAGCSPRCTDSQAPGTEDERGPKFAPLPATRLEVEKIAALYPEARVYLGSKATEEEAKSLPRKTRYVHFAVHGWLDERQPLDSAIVLSLPESLKDGRNNGLLQAWEIFEQVRLDADLVTLSACESALGKELGGEGLISLTRAFQFAGARSVLASLWNVADRTTAELMVRFYRHLKEGMPKDEALRAAQMEFIHGPIKVRDEKGEEVEIDASAPYYWAAFQVYGDWQ